MSEDVIDWKAAKHSRPPRLCGYCILVLSSGKVGLKLRVHGAPNPIYAKQE